MAEQTLRQHYEAGYSLPRPVIFRERSGVWYVDAAPDVQGIDRPDGLTSYFATHAECVAWLIENDPRRSTT